MEFGYFKKNVYKPVSSFVNKIDKIIEVVEEGGGGDVYNETNVYASILLYDLLVPIPTSNIEMLSVILIRFIYL